ncbi:hypothetical protein WICPIJ_000868 [Wickerhamomyces pijperi]|uniref:Uncharacterized protein n=1 Tax=Wickerhamomyces pijperi TaxID=599730 RepID=A0A9P8TRB1_WICPI|nr:hypothetical protein WICPIJ_000868 [Wickerhamomyces pijperi]
MKQPPISTILRLITSYLVLVIHSTQAITQSSHHTTAYTQQCYLQDGPFHLSNITIQERPFVESPSHHQNQLTDGIVDHSVSFQGHTLGEQNGRLGFIWDYLDILSYLDNNLSLNTVQSTGAGMTLGMFWDPARDLQVRCELDMFVSTASYTNKLGESDKETQQKYTCSVTMKSNKESVKIPESLVHVVSLSYNGTLTAGKKADTPWTYQYKVTNIHGLYCVSLPTVSKLYDITYQTLDSGDSSVTTVSQVVGYESVFSMVALLVISAICIALVKSKDLRLIIVGISGLSVFKSLALLINQFAPKLFMLSATIWILLLGFCSRHLFFKILYPKIFQFTLKDELVSSTELQKIYNVTTITFSTYTLLSFLLMTYSLTDPYRYYCLGLSNSIQSNPVVLFIGIKSLGLCLLILWLAGWFKKWWANLSSERAMDLRTVRWYGFVWLMIMVVYPVISSSFSLTWCMLTWLRDVDGAVAGYINNDWFIALGVWIGDFCYAVVVLGLTFGWFVIGVEGTADGGYDLLNSCERQDFEMEDLSTDTTEELGTLDKSTPNQN